MSGMLISLKRSSLDVPWGFRLQKISDDLPPTVTKVSKYSLAEMYGLKPGDYFLEVKGVNVTRMSCGDVMNVIKDSEYEISVMVVREGPCDNQPSYEPPTNQHKPNVPSNPPQYQVSKSPQHNNDYHDRSESWKTITNGYSCNGPRTVRSPHAVEAILPKNGEITQMNDFASLQITPTILEPVEKIWSTNSSPSKIKVEGNNVQNKKQTIRGDDDDDEVKKLVENFGGVEVFECFGSGGGDDDAKQRKEFLNISNNSSSNDTNMYDGKMENDSVGRHQRVDRQQQQQQQLHQLHQLHLLHPLLLESLPLQLQQQLMSHLQSAMTNIQHQRHHVTPTYPIDTIHSSSPYRTLSNTPIDLRHHLTFDPIIPPPSEFFGSLVPTPVQSLDGESWLSFDPHSESSSSLSSSSKPYTFDSNGHDLHQQILNNQSNNQFLGYQQQQFRDVMQRNGKVPSPIDSLQSADSIQPYSLRSSPLEHHGFTSSTRSTINSFHHEPPIILPPPSPFMESSEEQIFPLFNPSESYYTVEKYHDPIVRDPMKMHNDNILSNYSDNNQIVFSNNFNEEISHQNYGNSFDILNVQAYPGLSYYHEPHINYKHALQVHQPHDVPIINSSDIEQDQYNSRTSSATPVFMPECHSKNLEDALSLKSEIINQEISVEHRSVCVTEIDIPIYKIVDDIDEGNQLCQPSLQALDAESCNVISEAYFDLEQSQNISEDSSIESYGNTNLEKYLIISSDDNNNNNDDNKIDSETLENSFENFQSYKNSDLREFQLSLKSEATQESSPSSSSSSCLRQSSFESTWTIANSEEPKSSNVTNFNSSLESNVEMPTNKISKLNYLRISHDFPLLQNSNLDPGNQIDYFNSNSQEPITSQHEINPTQTSTSPYPSAFHICPHCHSSLPSFITSQPFWTSGQGYDRIQDHEPPNRAPPPPPPPLPMNLLQPTGQQVKISRRKSLQPNDVPDSLSGLLTKAGRNSWSYVPDKKAIEEQSQKIRQSLMRKYSRRASEIDIPTLERKVDGDKPLWCKSTEDDQKSQKEFDEDEFLRRIKKISSDEQQDQPKTFQMLRKTFSKNIDPVPSRPTIRHHSQAPRTGAIQPEDKLIYSGKKIPSRIFNRLETTMARMAEAELKKRNDVYLFL